MTTFRARKILYDDKNNLKPYQTWPVLDYWDNRKELYLCPTGNNGILYSSDFFDERVFDPVFRKICPSRSDIWFSASVIANQILKEQITAKRINDNENIIPGSRFPELSPTFFLKRYRKFEWPNLWAFNRPLNDNMINAVFKYYSISK